MSQLELIFFLSFLGIQLLIPLRRFIKTYLLPSGSGDILASDRALFSWTMKLKAQQGELFFIVYLKDGGEEVGVFKPEDFLTTDQVRFLLGHPSSCIQFVKFLEEILCKEAEGPIDHLGIKVFHVLDINQRGSRVMIDEERDLRLESVHILRSYDWVLHH